MRTEEEYLEQNKIYKQQRQEIHNPVAIIFAPVLLVGFWFLSFIVSQIKRGINNVR